MTTVIQNYFHGCYLSIERRRERVHWFVFVILVRRTGRPFYFHSCSCYFCQSFAVSDVSGFSC